jgi:hypothetical protein
MPRGGRHDQAVFDRKPEAAAVSPQALLRQIGFGILFGRPVDEVTSVDHQGDRRDRSSPNKVRDMFVPDLHIGTLEVKAPN